MILIIPTLDHCANFAKGDWDFIRCPENSESAHKCEKELFDSFRGDRVAFTNCSRFLGLLPLLAEGEREINGILVHPGMHDPPSLFQALAAVSHNHPEAVPMSVAGRMAAFTRSGVSAEYRVPEIEPLYDHLFLKETIPYAEAIKLTKGIDMTFETLSWRCRSAKLFPVVLLLQGILSGAFLPETKDVETLIRRYFQAQKDWQKMVPGFSLRLKTLLSFSREETGEQSRREVADALALLGARFQELKKFKR